MLQMQQESWLFIAHVFIMALKHNAEEVYLNSDFVITTKLFLFQVLCTSTEILLQ